jgi:hypothetical protein
MKLNLNEAEAPTRDFTRGGVIPEDEEVRVVLNLLAGDDEETDNLLTCSKNSGIKYLAVEFTIIGGPYNKRKFWENWALASSDDSGGHKKAIEISRTKVRAVVEAVREIKPTDNSAAANKQRNIDLGELDGMEFDCVLGIEEGKGEYKDKNLIKRVINPAAGDNAAAHGTKRIVASSATKSGTGQSAKKSATTQQPKKAAWG